MSRHLSEYFIEQTLKRGKSVGQFLGLFEYDGQNAIRYLLLYQRDQGFVLWVQESYDEGSEDFCDIGEFTPIHRDDLIQHTYPTLAQTLDHAAREYGAHPERWVNESVIGDEYAYALQNKQP